MDISYIKKLIKLLDESGIDEIEIEEEGKKVRVSKAHRDPSPQPFYYPAPMPYPQGMQQTAPPAADPPPPAETPAASAAKADEKKYHEIKSPIVGTFYSAPAPNADRYVEIGSTVQQGTVLCIIEAMKLMNEIESDISGKVVQVLVENGKPVEYNQPLFLIDPA
jgi:acetyl-CoA carboxylase biotin carboxyl carrier protein